MLMSWTTQLHSLLLNAICLELALFYSFILGMRLCLFWAVFGQLSFPRLIVPMLDFVSHFN